MRFTGVPELRRLRVLWRTSCPQNVHDVFFWRVRVGLNGCVLRDAHKISVWKRIGVTLRQLFRHIGPKRERAIAGTRSQKRSALARLNPPQEAIPVCFLKFAGHIKQTNEVGCR
jgi:hypothetical protein